jgi:hypothetical protein
MKVSEMLAERGLEIDDVRWYLASTLAGRLLEHRSRRTELVRLIWSGKLEAELYRAEERFLEELQRKADAGAADEPALREIIGEITAERRKRLAEGER